jgi:lipopolysaccharide/colanic/teichoic acid biosynthesis glycosyltransferase
MYRHFLKRFFDFILSISGFLILFPIFILVFILLFFANKGNPFFTQLRPGKDEKLFTIFKFKTMNDRKNEHGYLLSDDQRLTLIGKFIRKTSLDEIPQLVNVIKGDMSLIGPRPLMITYLPLYNVEQKRRHNVRPGITGWAQINGRNNISWKRKLELDIWYVDHISFKLDAKIILMTIKKVFLNKDISKEGMSTTDSFDGTN